MSVGDPNRHRPPEPHVQTMRVPAMAEIDFAALRRERLDRLQAMMRKRDIPVALFYNPANIRYATGVDVMGVWTATTFARCCIVAAEGDPVLFEYPVSMHVAEKHVKDVRPHRGYQFMGHQGYDLAREWAEGVKDVMRELGCAGEPLAVDKLDGNGFRALADLGVHDHGSDPRYRRRPRGEDTAGSEAHARQRHHR